MTTLRIRDVSLFVKVVSKLIFYDHRCNGRSSGVLETVRQFLATAHRVDRLATVR